MNYFEMILLNQLRASHLEMKITGFDSDGFQKAVQEEGKRRLDMIAGIVYEAEDFLSDTEKVESIKKLFQNEF